MVKGNEKGSTLLISLLALSWVIFAVSLLATYALEAQETAQMRTYSHNLYTMAEQGAVFYCDEINQCLRLQQEHITKDMELYTSDDIKNIPQEGIDLIETARVYLAVAELFFEETASQSDFENSLMSMNYEYQMPGAKESDCIRVRQEIKINDIGKDSDSRVEELVSYDLVKENLRIMEQGLAESKSWDAVGESKETLEKELNQKSAYGIVTTITERYSIEIGNLPEFRDYQKQQLWTALAYDAEKNQMVVQWVKAERKP